MKNRMNKNFEYELELALQNRLMSNSQIKVRNFTPDILIKNGVRNLPMLITQKHIKSIIYNLNEAERLNLPIKNINYHGIGKRMLIDVIESLDRPNSVYKMDEKNYLIITEFVDCEKNKIIVPIEIDAIGRYNGMFIDENQIKSVYGKRKIIEYLDNKKYEIIYKKKKH